jgi:hypothetical protein
MRRCATKGAAITTVPSMAVQTPGAWSVDTQDPKVVTAPPPSGTSSKKSLAAG